MVSLGREAGTTLVEVIFCVAIVAMLLASFSAYALGRKLYAIRAAVTSFASLVSDARAVAQTSGTGATIVITSASGAFTAKLYPYRPLQSADLSAPAVRTLGGTVSVTPIAIFISSSGAASATAWSAGSGFLASEPPCTSPIALEFSDGYASETHTIPCAQAQLL